MADHGVSAVPVLGADGVVVSLFSSTDLRALVSRVDIYPFMFRSMREFIAAKVCVCLCSYSVCVALSVCCV
jgi:CBS domain-containing protein